MAVDGIYLTKRRMFHFENKLIQSQFRIIENLGGYFRTCRGLQFFDIVIFGFQMFIESGLEIGSIFHLIFFQKHGNRFRCQGLDDAFADCLKDQLMVLVRRK